jgi:FHA domain
MSHPTLQVFFIRDGELARSEVFAEGLYTVGRGEDVDLRLDADGIEALHALIEFKNGEMKITAHAASSGIEVNGERVSSAQISQFDEVRLGHFMLKSRVLSARPGPRPKVSVAPRAQPPARPQAPAARQVSPAIPLAAAPVTAKPAPSTPRMGGAPPMMAQVTRAPQKAPPPPPPPDAPIVAKGKDSSDLEELDFLFDAALAEQKAATPAKQPAKQNAAKPVEEAPVELDLEESALLLRELDDAPPKPAQTVQIERTQWFEPAPAEEAVLQLATEKPKPKRNLTPSVPLAKVETTRIHARPRAAPAAGLERRAPTGSMLLASIFWGDTLLLAQTFRPGAPVFNDEKARATLQLYGFAKGAPVVESKGSAWSVVPPAAALSELREGKSWIAAPSGSKEIRLEAGAALRLTSGRFHLQLSAEAAPRTAQVMFWQHVDQRLFWLIMLSMISVWGFVLALPKAQATLPQEMQKEIVHNVRMSIEREKKEKPKPKPAEKKKEEPVLAEKKVPPPVIAQATTLKQAQAAVPIRSLDKLNKATKGLGNLLASLGPAVGKKGGSLSGLPLLPTVGSAPAPLPGLGGTGSGGGIGPITKGAELLRGGGVGGLLGSSTAGRGSVQGVPVAMPTRATQVKGSIDRDAVAKVINEHLNDVRGCYERALMRDPNLGAGKVLLEWTISPTGAVGEVKTKLSTLKSADATRCMADVVKQMQFPKPAGGDVIVSYPFLFNSVGL